MTQMQQVGEDLKFIRKAVEKRGRTATPPISVNYVWAVYVLVGYALIDLAPNAAVMFFCVGGIVGGVLSVLIGRQNMVRLGEYDRAGIRKTAWHWGGGVLMCLFATLALAAAIPALRGTVASQVCVVMIGVVYFLGGVHFDRNFLWLGPVLIVGGVCVGFVPDYGWTTLGTIIAAGLVVPSFFKKHA
jgi:hypothetical protein